MVIPYSSCNIFNLGLEKNYEIWLRKGNIWSNWVFWDSQLHLIFSFYGERVLVYIYISSLPLLNLHLFASVYTYLQMYKDVSMNCPSLYRSYQNPVLMRFKLSWAFSAVLIAVLEAFCIAPHILSIYWKSYILLLLYSREIAFYSYI